MALTEVMDNQPEAFAKNTKAREYPKIANGPLAFESQLIKLNDHKS
jgi:hypothetical protein